MSYTWLKFNIFTRWTSATNQMSCLLFDMDSPIVQPIMKSMTTPGVNNLADPFWPYNAIAGEVARLKDDAVWAIRNQVRAIETERRPAGKPSPNYRLLHDMARHAIHVTETLEVDMETLDRIVQQHKSLDSSVRNSPAWQNVHQQLLFDRQMVISLRHRSVSNEKRLQNEMKLAFHTVAQYDSGISLRIGQAAQTDSSAMKTVSLLTLAFLPPTFMCSLFSTSFFNYDISDGWTMSNYFWIYWVFTIPITLATSVLCLKWQTRSSFYCNDIGSTERKPSISEA
jgi:hypothetical protein